MFTNAELFYKQHSQPPSCHFSLPEETNAGCFYAANAKVWQGGKMIQSQQIPEE